VGRTENWGVLKNSLATVAYRKSWIEKQLKIDKKNATKSMIATTGPVTAPNGAPCRTKKRRKQFSVLSFSLHISKYAPPNPANVQGGQSGKV
jgi:hypothetical protein